jgi:DNA replication protein DnaC
MEKFVQCRKCLNKNVSLKSGKPIVPPGFIVEQTTPKGSLQPTDTVRECECHLAWRKKHELEVSAKSASLSPQWIDYDLSKDYVGTESKDNVTRIINYVELSNQDDLPNDVKERLKAAVLYLYGTNGTQKTTIANWMGYQFLKAKKSVKYILMNDLIKMLQKAERDESVMTKLEKLEDVDLLLIDEAFDKEKVTIYKSNFQVPFLDSFLRSRMQTKHKGIIFISNVSPYDIEAKGFNYSIQDLVVRNMNKEKGFMEFKDRYDSIKSTVDTNTLF